MNKILVIEDEPQVRSNIEEILTWSGFQAVGAPDGLAGVHLAKEELPDLILCDVMMPELDGYEVLSRLRQDDAMAMIPFIFLTAKADRSHLRQGMEYGADDYLTKPFTPKELLTAIATQLNKQKMAEKRTSAALNQLSSNITRSLPHELLTPLNGILGFSQFLLEDHALMETPEGLEVVEAIYGSARRLHRLTQNFLLYSDLELIAADPDRVKALRHGKSQSEIWNIVVEIAVQKAHAANRENDLHLDIQNHWVTLSETKLRKVLEELLDNAFKFSLTGTPVRVVGRFEEDFYHLDIIDYGRGMTAEQIKAIAGCMQFDRSQYEQQGMGMGLILARRIVELQGGELTIDSLLGQQTTVHVVIPC